MTNEKKVLLFISQNLWMHEKTFSYADCIGLKGVAIGIDSVIGAGTVVANDIYANAIVCGSPAKDLKVRILDKNGRALKSAINILFCEKYTELLNLC